MRAPRGSRASRRGPCPSGREDRQSAVPQQRVVEALEREGGAHRLAVRVEQPEDFTAADGITELIRRPCAVAPHLGLRTRPLDRQVLHHVVHRGRRTHPACVKTDIHHDANRPPEQVDQPEEPLFHGCVVAGLLHELLAVERPPFHHDRRPDVATHLGTQLLRGDELQVVAGVGLVNHHRGNGMAAVAAQLLGPRLRRQHGIGTGHVEASPLRAEIDRRRLVRRERHQRHEKRRRRHDVDRAGRDGNQVAREHELVRSFELAPVNVDDIAFGGVLAQPVHQLPPRRRSHLGGQRRQLRLGFFLEAQAVAPELGRPRLQRVLVVEAAPELILADRKRQGVGIRLDVVAQLHAEPRQGLERALGGGLQPLAKRRLLLAHRRRHLRDQLPATAEHDEGGIDEDRRRLDDGPARRFEKARNCLHPLEHRLYTPRYRTRGPRQDRIERLKEMREPVAWIADAGLLVLPPEDAFREARRGARCGRSRPRDRRPPAPRLPRPPP